MLGTLIILHSTVIVEISFTFLYYFLTCLIKKTISNLN